MHHLSVTRLLGRKTLQAEIRRLLAPDSRSLGARIAAAFRTFSSQRDGGRFNVGVLGAGRIGRMHLSNILNNRRFNLRWVLEDKQEACSAVREELGLHDTPFHQSDKLSSLLSDSGLDAVFIFTSTPSHTALTCQALDSGKAVFVEKPAGESVADIKRCYDAAERNNKPFFIGFKRRFDPTMSEAYRKVISGTIGKLQYLRFTSRDSPKPSYDFLKTCDTTRCNILADVCVHDVDLLVWLTQSERPEHIYVTTHAHDEVMAEFGEADSIGVMIKYGSGAIASLDAARESVYGYDIRMEIFGSKGLVLANNPRETEVTVDLQDGCHKNRLYNSFPQRFEVAFQAELDHFLDCLDGRASPLITRTESLLVAEIIDKGLESFRLKKPVFF